MPTRRSGSTADFAAARDWIAFHCGAPSPPIAAAPRFALAAALPDLRRSARRQRRGAGRRRRRVILQVAALGSRARAAPGRARPARRRPSLAVDGLPDDFAARLGGQPRAVPARHRPDAVRRRPRWPPCRAASRSRRAERWPMSRSKAASGRSTTPMPGSPRSGAATRRSPELGARPDRASNWPRGRPGDGRGLAVRPRPRGAGDQAGAGRPDRGGVPAARLPHHAAPLRRTRCRSTPPRCACGAAFRPSSRTCRAARCSARPTTTPTGCWISRWPATGARRRRAAGAEPDATPMPRVHDILGHEGLIEPRCAPADGRAGRPDARAAALSRPGATCGCRRWRAATRASCWRSAIRPSAATAAPTRSPARSAWARWRSRSSRRNSASPSTSATSTLTECQMVNQFTGSKTAPPQFTRGYGLAFGHGERKAMAMALVDRAMRAEELGEDVDRAGAERRVRAVPLRQHRGDRLRRAPEAAALRRFPERAGNVRRMRAEAGRRDAEAAE